jgi:hypothetical protein
MMLDEFLVDEDELDHDADAEADVSLVEVVNQ